MLNEKNNRPIVVIDSGIGGLSVLFKLYPAFPYENFVYLCNEAQVPLGNKSVAKIEAVCKKFINAAKKRNAKLLIVACNTMSLAGERIFKECGLPVVLVTPEKYLCGQVKNQIGLTDVNNRSKKNEKILFCTVKSSENPRIVNLAELCGYTVVGLKNLAADIEKRGLCVRARKELAASVTISGISAEKVKKIYLGCTHYALIKDVFFKVYKYAEIVDGTENICEEVKKYTEYSPGCGRVRFLGSGRQKAKRCFYGVF